MVSPHVFGFLLFSHLVQVVSAGKCPSSFACGYLGDISFPFTNGDHPDCGLLVIHGCDDEPGIQKNVQSNNIWFEIKSVYDFTITIRDDGLHDLLLSRSCEVFSHNSSFRVSSALASSRMKYNATMLRCSDTLDPQSSPKGLDKFSNSTICSSSNDAFYGFSPDVDLAFEDLRSSDIPKSCSMVQLPMTYEGYWHDLDDLVNFTTADIPFEIHVSPACYHCHHFHGGQCKIDRDGNFYCDKGKTRKIWVIVAAVASVVGALVVTLVAWCLRRRFCIKENPTHQIIETFLKYHGHLAAKRYSYLEVKKATNSFKNKLGQGGYGSVYKGKLHDGTLVAVKVLSESKGNGEEFINEVASISVTSHVNIVSLLGFCLEGSKRALIYKYMPNGSVEKFIYEDKDPSKLNLQLTCKTMYNIAIGVARGLEYLHKGCNTKIVHFDIKPHNILLDEDFCPKISDFGLAKVCTKKESIVSLLGARGTAGYIAPEVFSRNFGGVSHKSDVYSYGMMIIEMVGGRKNVNVQVEAEVECSSEIYFPHWIYKRLELNQELGMRCIKNEIDKEMVRKMIIVSLWCIQPDPSNRPAMSKVVDMMEGSLDSLQIPPKPYLSSPPRSLSVSSDRPTQTCQASYPSESINKPQQCSAASISILVCSK